MLCPDLSRIIPLADAGEFNCVPVSMSVPTGGKTPIDMLRILKNVSGHCYLLESAQMQADWGRYTFLGYDPRLEITCSDGQMRVGDLSFETKDPGKYIRQVLAEHKSCRFPGQPPFTGGLVGYFSFDYLKYAEPTLRLDAQDTEGFKDVDLMLFDKVIAFDHERDEIVLVVSMSLADPATNYRRAELMLEHMASLLALGEPKWEPPGRLTNGFTELFSKERYCAMVEAAKEHIREGDIFQMVPSNRLEAGFEGSLLGTYEVLRTLNPSPYMFYFSSSDLEVAGASPETLVKLEDGVLHTFPLAGSRPRGGSEAEDLALERELLADEKERAEHNMLVDLGRNDLGKISRFGSVTVEKYMQVLRFSHIMHIGSVVRGELAPGRDALDAIDAVLPAGTLSGAPKLRAVQLINDMEDNKRGIYGGAIGYIDFTGNLDTCIGIRIAYKKNGRVFVRSGAGIVADSVPEREYEECIHKAQAVVTALKTAQGGDAP